MEHSFKLGLVEQYVENQTIEHIIPHARLPYLIVTFKYCVVILLLGLIYGAVANLNLPLNLLFAILGIMLFGKYIYDFLDKYMDTAVLTDKGITIVTIDGRFKYKVDFFERKNIASLRFSQDGFISKLFNEGDITISLDHDSDYTLEGVSRPQKQTTIINKLKFDSLAKAEAAQVEVDIVDQPDKFEMLVDTLGEVIGAYMRGK